MPTFICTREIPAAPETVFAIATDFAGAAEHVRAIQSVEMLTPGPVRPGTRFRETRTVLGRTAAEEFEVLALDPPRSLLLGAESHGTRYRIELRFEPSGVATLATMRFEAQPLSLLAKILAFLIRPLMKKVQAECANDLEDLAAAAARATSSEAPRGPRA